MKHHNVQIRTRLSLFFHTRKQREPCYGLLYDTLSISVRRGGRFQRWLCIALCVSIRLGIQHFSRSLIKPTWSLRAGNRQCCVVVHLLPVTRLRISNVCCEKRKKGGRNAHKPAFVSFDFNWYRKGLPQQTPGHCCGLSARPSPLLIYVTPRIYLHPPYWRSDWRAVVHP